MRVTTAWAMSITGVNRLKFNEAVAAGHYQCAPETTERTTRDFDFPDLIGLAVFGRLLNLGLSKRLAGQFACKTVGYVHQYGTDLERVVMALNGDGNVWAGPYFGEGQDNGRPYIDPNSAAAAASIQINIPQIRSFLIDRCHQVIAIYEKEETVFEHMFPEGWEKKV